MPKLLYISLMRMPTEKAHGLQIMQNCEAFAAHGYDVQLWVARRWNSPEMRQIQDPYAYYGVHPSFSITRIPCLDLMPLAFQQVWLERVAFYIQIITYIFFMLLRLPFTNADVFYSRDEYLLLALNLFRPKHKLAYEAHLYPSSNRGRRLQSAVVGRVGSMIAITPRLREMLVEFGAEPEQVIVAHDGIRKERFADIPGQAEARHHIGWEQDQFIVGFVGRLQMIGMDKGVGTLIQSVAQLEHVAIALVGGPDEAVDTLKARWLASGKSEEDFLYAGHVQPQAVPLYLSAFDVCVMPHPAIEQFAKYTSPLKLFEYMASKRAIIASDLPSWADVIEHEQNVLLVPPSDVDVLRDSIMRLKEDRDLRIQLANNAYEKVMIHYTWEARTKAILRHIKRLMEQV